MSLIYGYIPKAKKQKVPKSVVMRRELWEKDILAISPKTNGIVPKRSSASIPSLKVPAGRETPHFASLTTGFGLTNKPNPNIYTGTKVKGIATMHKSNAVPVFTDEEAVSISSMRR
jgi:hypothetical protein